MLEKASENTTGPHMSNEKHANTSDPAQIRDPEFPLSILHYMQSVKSKQTPPNELKPTRLHYPILILPLLESPRALNAPFSIPHTAPRSFPILNLEYGGSCIFSFPKGDLDYI